MQNAASFGQLSTNTNVAAQNGQVASAGVDTQSLQTQQNTSIFNQNQSSVDINKSDSNSQGTGGIGNIFESGGVTSSTGNTSSIFSGLNKGSQYSLYSKKDYNYDVPKLTQEDIASQKAAEGPKRTNPKAYNIDMTPKANPYEAYRNAEMQDNSFSDKISSAFAGLFGQKKAD